MEALKPHTQEELCHDIHLLTHDLRNRLSALKLNLYVLERQLDTQLCKSVQTMNDDIRQINIMLEELDHLPDDLE